MGKTTLYHPVSLYVIRASLISSGITPGRIKQLHVEPEIGQALYSTVITKLPKSLRYKSSRQLMDDLQSCFAADVLIVQVSDTYRRYDDERSITVTFRTHLYAPPLERDSLADPEPYRGHDSDHDAPQSADDDLTWLSDDDPTKEIHHSGTFGENSGDFISF